MDGPLRTFLLNWNWRPDVLSVLVTLGTAYAIGWWRLRKRGARAARPWRLGVYLAGLGSVGLALLSPIDALGSVLFLMHMVQHELLIMIAAPLLLLADPLPACLWALPRGPRRAVRRLLGRGAPVRRVLRAATWMPVAWGIFVVTLWAWHLPAIYEAALRHELLHDLEHVSLFGTALLFWWPIINPAPRLRRQAPFGFRIVYIVAAALQNAALGFTIGVTERVLYPSYAAAPRLWGLSPLDDQAFGGGIMSEGGMMFLVPLLVVLWRWLNEEERRTRERESLALRSGETGR